MISNSPLLNDIDIIGKRHAGIVDFVFSSINKTISIDPLNGANHNMNQVGHYYQFLLHQYKICIYGSFKKICSGVLYMLISIIKNET